MTPVEGQLFSGQIATFSDPNSTKQVGDYSATITWGDNTSNSAGAVVMLSDGSYAVDGSHVYAAEGPYIVSVSVMGPSTGNFSAKVISEAIVSD